MIPVHHLRSIKISKSFLQEKPKGFSANLRNLIIVLVLLTLGTDSVWAQTTKTWVSLTGGSWTTAANWSPTGAPVANDHVIIPANQSQPITGIPAISLRKFIIRGNCQLEAASANNLVTVNDSFVVANGATVNFGTTSSKFSITLAATSVGKIDGTFVQNSNTPAGTFTNNGVLELEPGAFISGVGSFALNAGGTLRIGSPNGIVTGTTASGNIRVTGTRTYSNAANYIYDGVEDQVTGNGLPTGITGSLTIENDNTVTLSLARSITSGSLNLNKGVFAASNLLSLGTNTASSAVTIVRAEGSLTGTLQGANFYSINYIGTSKMILAEASGAGMRNIQMNMDAGQVLTAQNNLTIPGSLTLTNGQLNAGDNTIVVNGLLYGGSALSYVMGRLQLPFPSGTTSQFFPLGSASGYAPVFINFGSAVPAGVFTASTIEGDPVSIESSTINVYRTVNRYWSLQPGASLANSTYSSSFEWNADNTDSDFDPAIAIAGKFSNSSWTYPTISSNSGTSIALSGQSGAAEYTFGKTCTYTSITKQPVGGAICADGSLELSVEGDGDGTLNFQWLKDGENITDAISSTYTVTEGGTYTIVVAGECRSVTSEEATVSIKPLTVIKASPTGGMKCAGDILLVEAEGSGTLQFQWKRNEVDIEGATANTYAVSEQGTYSVSVTGECGAELSEIIEVDMHAPTAVTLQPEGKEITYGESVSFSVEGAGTGDLTYRWQVQDGSSWIDVAEENVFNSPSSSLFSLTTPSGALSGSLYKCVVTGFCGDAVSNEVNLVIRKAVITISATDHTRIYGDENPEFEYSYAGFVNSEDLESSDIKGTPSLVTTAVPSTGVGIYDITPEIGSLLSDNYTFDYVGAKLTIEQAPLTVTAVKKTRYYGDPNPEFSVEYVGLKNSETVQTCDVTGSPVFSVDANELSIVGIYDVLVEPGDVASTNYALSFENSTLEVEKAVLTIAPADIVITYGDTIPALSYSITGYKNGEEGVEGVITGSPTISTDVVNGAGAGTYEIVMTEGDLSSSNYSFDIKAGTVTINKASLEVIANDASRVYGDPNPSLTYSLAGFIPGEDISNSGVLGTPDLITTADQQSAAGTYDITVSNGDMSSSNYQFIFKNAVLTVNKAVLTVKALDKLRIYGEPNPVFEAVYNGYKNGEELATSGVSGSPAFNTNATLTSSVGSYNINPGLGSLQSGNYQFSYVSGKLYIGKSQLTVRVDTMRRDFARPNPSFTYKVSGFKNGETLATSGVMGTPGMTTTANIASLAGQYPINAVVGTLTATNYSFDVFGGQLNIDLAMTITSKSPVCPTLEEGSLTVNGLGSPGTIEYSIDNGSTFSSSTDYSGLVAGTYRIIARDDLGNTSRDTSVVLRVDVIRWVGTSNGNPSSRVAWENAANWNGGRVPSTTSHVIIPGISGLIVDVNSNVQAASVQVGSGARLNINSNFKLTTTGKCPVLPAQ